MRTKSFSAKRLLSLVLTVAMFATMILPTGVFAADNGTITTDLDDKTIVKGERVEFTVTSTKNEVGGQIWVKGKFEVEAKDTDIDSIEYYETTEDIKGWYPFTTNYDGNVVSGLFGPIDTGFPMMDATSQFSVTFAEAGTYKVTVSAVKVDDGSELCSETIKITVYDAYADYTALKSAVSTAKTYDETKYTKASYKVLSDAVDAAEKAIAEKWASNKQDDVDGLVDDINNAIAALDELADFAALNTAIASANAANTDNCTADSIEALEKALEVAEKINQETTTVDKQITVVDAATTALNNAIAGLTQLANFTTLNDAIAAAGTYDEVNYTKGSYADLKSAVTAANAIDKANEADQTKVDNAVNAITTAITNLVETRVVEFTAAAVASNVTKNYAKADKVYLVFSEGIKNSPNLIADLKVGGKAASEYLEHSKWVDNTIYEMNIIKDIEDASIDFAGNDDVLAVAGHALKAYSTSIVGNLDEAYEEVTATAMTATIVNIDDKPYMVDGDEIVLVFNAPVYGNPDTITVEGMTFTVVANTSNTVYKKVLDADKDTVAAGKKLTFVDAKNRTINATLAGTFGDTVVPVVVRALVEDADGTAKTVKDKINVFFNASTNKVAGAEETNFTGVLAGSKGVWVDNQTLVITLGETTITITDKIDLSNLGIKDFYGTEDADADEIELEGSFGTAVQPGLLTLTAISKQGKGAPSAGDEIYLAFNVKMREDALNLQTDFDFGYGDYGTGASVAWASGAEYAEYSTIIITLGEGAKVVPGETKITIVKELFEESGTKKCKANNLENRIVTGTFGTSIAPSLISASIVKRSTQVGSQPGDQIVLLFNVPTNAADIINLISVAGGDLGNNVEEGVWSNNNTIYTITLGDGTSIANDTSITFTNTNGVLKDINNQKVASTKTLDLNGSFGVEADEVGISPSSVTATIVKTTAVAGAQAGDQIVFAFNVATNGVDLKNYFASKGIFGSTGLDGGWSNGNTIYTLVLGEGATVTDTNVVEFSVEAGIKDKNEINGAVTLTAGTFIGSFGATIVPSSVAPELLSATIIKGNGNTSGAAQAGDKVVFAFNMATNKADLFANLGGTTLFGSGVNAGGAWNEDGNIYTVTLGDNATITDNTILTITADAGLKDKQSYSASAVINNIELIGSFGIEVVPVAPQPELLRVDIIKASADMGAQPGDKLRFIFNISTNEVDDLISKIQQTLNGSTIVAFGENASGLWVEKNIYEITLGTNPNMQTGVKLVIPASAGIKDESGTSVAKEYTVNEFNGTFGESIAPVALSAVAFSDDGVDYIEVVFNVAVKRLADGIMIFENNSNFLGTEPYGEWMSDNIYRITLDDNYTITNTSLLHFNDTYKILSKDGNAEMAAGSTIAVTGELRKPMVTEVYAGTKIVNGDDVTYEAAETITIVFSSKTNGGEIDLSAQSSLLGIGATATWNDAKTELTIALGTDRKISAGSGYILLNGLGITNGFDNNEVVGQYSISAGILPEDELETDLIRVNTREDSNNYMTVIFNAPTNMYGKTLATEFNMSDIEANIEATHTFGTGATAEWETASKLVIKLGADSTFKNEKAVAANATVTFKNLKFANGLGSIKVEAEKVTGSFDGRETALDKLTAKVEGDYTIATVTLTKQDLDFGKNVEPEGDEEVDNFDAIVTFVIWDKDGKLVTDMNSMNIDVNAVDEIELQSKFATKEAGKVDVYVTDTYIDAITEGTPAFDLLADTVTSSVAAQ